MKYYQYTLYAVRACVRACVMCKHTQVELCVYLLFILCIEFRVARIQAFFFPKSPIRQKTLSSPGLVYSELKFTLEVPMKAYSGSRGVAVLFL